MPSSSQFEQILNLSDNVLYPEAVAFMHRLVEEEGCSTLPASQVTGLLNIANAATYSALLQFIQHQRDRNWPESKKDIKTFYTELEKWFTTVKSRRIRQEFHLVREEQDNRAMLREVDELMILLAHDFIQHLVAENGLLAVKRASMRAKRR